MEKTLRGEVDKVFDDFATISIRNADSYGVSQWNAKAECPSSKQMAELSQTQVHVFLR